MLRLPAPASWHLGAAAASADRSGNRPLVASPARLRAWRARLLALLALYLAQPALLGLGWLLGPGSAAEGGLAGPSGEATVLWWAWAAVLCAALTLWLLAGVARDTGLLLLQASRGRRALRQLAARTRERDLALQERDGALRKSADIADRARLDDVTGLLNRATFIGALDDAVAACSRASTPVTVMFIDLDDFKQVNDRHGHAAGDALLRAFAARLQAGIRSSDLAARIGGDEFAVLARGLDMAGAIAMAGALTDKLLHPYALGDLDIRVSASIGLAGGPGQGQDALALLRTADAAMYRAKSAGKGVFMTAAMADGGHIALAGGRSVLA